MDYLMAFVVVGLICVAAQILIDKTKLTSARVLVLFVILGAILQGLGLYQKLVDIAGAGATFPLPGFGYSLAKGTIKEVKKIGLTEAFTVGVPRAAGSLATAAFFGYIIALIFNPKSK